MRFATIKEATYGWVNEFNRIDQGMIQKLMDYEPDEWHEVTVPSIGDNIYDYETGDDGDINDVQEEDDELIYEIELRDHSLVYRKAEDFEVNYDYRLPIWGTMWTFGDSADDYWLEEMGGLKIMSDLGFRIFESEEFGYFFGIDGAGYDFYEAHWIPLYKARGLQWHDEV